MVTMPQMALANIEEVTRIQSEPAHSERSLFLPGDVYC